jgi:ATP-dependent RNA circularization protein (DNA/RNA ligase family)
MAKAKTSEKKQGIDSVVDEIKQKFGEGMIMKLGEVKKEAEKTISISSGVLEVRPNSEVYILVDTAK